MPSIINDYLKRCVQTFSAKKPFIAVLGNEGGDMDSIVGCIFLAFFLEKSGKLGRGNYIPLLNFDKNDFPLRNDVMKLFSSHGILIEYLLSAKGLPDMPDFVDLHQSEPNIVLYDHNRLITEQDFLSEKVIGVIDHHFDEKLYLEGSKRLRQIATVGSACTLVCNLFYETQIDVPCPELLLAPIVLDTVNFNPAQKKVTEKDIIASKRLTDLLGTNFNVDKLFNDLSLWKSDILGLTLPQNLRRDFKAFEFEDNDGKTLYVGISSIACRFDELIKAYTTESLASECVEFLKQRELSLVILAFAGERGAEVFCRQLAFFAKNKPLAALTAFAENSPDNISFTPIMSGTHNQWTWKAFELSDPSVSRKKLAPLLGNFLSTWSQSSL